MSKLFLIAIPYLVRFLLLHIDVDVNINFRLLPISIVLRPLFIVILFIVLLIQVIVVIWGLFLLMLLVPSNRLEVIHDQVTFKSRVLFDQSLVNFHAELVALSKFFHIIFKFGNKNAQKGFLGDLKALLNYIVAKIVNQKIEILIFIAHQAVYDLLIHLIGVELETFLNNIGAEFLLR